LGRKKIPVGPGEKAQLQKRHAHIYHNLYQLQQKKGGRGYIVRLRRERKREGEEPCQGKGVPESLKGQAPWCPQAPAEAILRVFFLGRSTRGICAGSIRRSRRQYCSLALADEKKNHLIKNAASCSHKVLKGKL